MMETDKPFSEIWEQFAENLKLGWSWSGFERSVMFLNDGNANFTNVANVLGLDQVTDGRAMSAVDIDNDGDLDLVGTSSRTAPHVYVLRNDFVTDRHHLFVELVPTENRDAESSKIIVTADGWSQRRDIVIGSGYRTQHTQVQHFGLRDHEEVDHMEITWPDGKVEVFENISVDQKIRVKQGTGSYQAFPHKAANYNASGRMADTNWHKFWDKLQLLPKPYVQLNRVNQTAINREEPVNFVEGWDQYGKDNTITVVNLWATWCANCRREMPELVDLHNDKESNIRLLGICMDEGKTPEEVLAAMEGWNMEFPTLYLQGEKREAFLNAISPLLSAQGGLALPTSLVLDPEGNCRAIIQGKVDIENLKLYVELMPFEKPSAE